MARYRRSQANSDISLECETENVPTDGRFHVLRAGTIVSSHRTLKAATSAYLALLDELGLSAKPTAAPAQPADDAKISSRVVGDYYVYGKSKRRRTGTRTYG